MSARSNSITLRVFFLLNVFCGGVISQTGQTSYGVGVNPGSAIFVSWDCRESEDACQIMYWGHGSYTRDPARGGQQAFWDTNVLRISMSTLTETGYNHFGTSGCEYPNDATILSGGNTLACWKLGAACGNCINTFYPGTSGYGCVDQVCTLLDSSNNAIWHQRMGGGGDDYRSETIVASNGDIIFMSQHQSGTNGVFGGDSGAGFLLGRYGITSTSLQSPVWKHYITPITNAFFEWLQDVQSIFFDASGNVVLLLSYTGTPVFAPYYTTAPSSNAGNKDVMIIILDFNTGNTIAKTEIGGPGDDVATSYAALGDAAGTFFVAIRTDDFIGDNPNTKTAPDSEFALCKFTQIGASAISKVGCYQWVVPGNDVKISLRYVPTRGELFFSMGSESDFDGPDLPGAAYGNHDIVIGAIDPATMVVTWSDQIGGPSADDPLMGIHVNAGATFLWFSFSTPPPGPAITVGVNNCKNNGGACTPNQKISYVFKYPICAPGHDVSKSDFKTCNPCAAGTASLRQNTCVDCAIGSYSNTAQSATCLPCPAGSFQNVTGQTSCQPCEIGTFTDSLGSAKCLPCPAGSYGSSSGLSECSPCPTDTYQDVAGSLECKACPVNGKSPPGSPKATFCQCGPGTFGKPMEGRECKTCPEFTNCPQDSAWPLPKAGYWLSTSDPYTVLACSPPEACDGGEGSTDDCAAGYTGDGCSECSTGYYRANGGCAECQNVMPMWVMWSLLAIAAAIGAVILLVCLAFVRIYAKAMGIVQKLLKVATILGPMLRFFQLSGLTMSVKIPWPIALTSIGGVFQVFNFSAELLQYDCMAGAGGLSLLFKHYLKILGFLCIGFVVLVIIPILGSLFMAFRAVSRPKEGETPVAAKLLSPAWFAAKIGSVQVLVTKGGIMGMSILYVILGMLAFTCYEKAPGEFYLVEDPTIKCFVTRGEWIEMVPISIVGFLVFSVGWPLLVVVTTFTAFPLRTKVPRMQELFGELWRKFEPSHFYWESIILLNKFLLGMALPIAALGPADQMTFLCMVSFSFFVLHSLAMPMVNFMDDMLEFVIGLTVHATAILGAVFMQEHTTQFERLAILVVVLVLYVLMFGFALWRIACLILIDAIIVPSVGAAKMPRNRLVRCLMGLPAVEKGPKQEPEVVVIRPKNPFDDDEATPNDNTSMS